MEVRDTKSPHLKAEAAIESFAPFAPIEFSAHQFLESGKLVVHRLACMLVSKIDTSKTKDRTFMHENFYSVNADLNRVLLALGNNPNTPADMLDHISIACPVSVSETIARNENASKATLHRLANHYSFLVRAAVTENCNASFETLACLCEDEHPDVRFSMAENPHVPKLLLGKLISDDNPYVASRACTTLARLSGIRSTDAPVWSSQNKREFNHEQSMD